MANITLATLAGYWQAVRDWVKGTDSTSAPKVTLSSAGRAVEEIVVFNAVAITSMNAIASADIDVSKYKEIHVFVIDTHDQDINVYPQAGAGVNIGNWVNGAWVPTWSSPAVISSDGRHHDLTTFYPSIKTGYKVLTFVAQAKGVPTTGSLTLKIWGVPN